VPYKRGRYFPPTIAFSFENQENIELSVLEFPENLEKFFGMPVDLVRKHPHLRPAFIKQIMQDIVYA
jgi:predicted nucleotidyltransferase